MQIVDNRLLLFRTRSPDKYSLIPKSRIVAEPAPGVYEVAVKWGLDEVKVLRNLGVRNVPSPIQGNYNWPGRHKPFEHQILTASFLTMNKRAYVFNQAGCVDSETEFLSPTGWKKISEYAGGQVAQYLPETGGIEFVDPEQYVKLPCEDMLRFKTKYGIDQMLSPEHRMIIHSSASKAKWSVMSAADVFYRHEDEHAGIKRPNPRKAGSSSVAFGSAAIPAAFSWAGGSGLSLTDAELRLQIAVIADGHFPNNTKNCIVRLKKERKIVRLRDLLAATGTPFRERADESDTGHGFVVFSFYAPLHLKKFDARFWAATEAQLAVVRDEVFHWDGADRGENKGSQFFSVEKESADFVQFAFSSAGIVARITEDVREGRRTCYVVTVRGDTNNLLTLKSRHSKTVTPCKSTDGFKYCFSVPSTFLVFRRNGCVFASGNTGKTMSCLWAADYLMKLGEVKRCLVVCPLSIMEAAWMKDIMHSVIHRTAIIAHSTSMEKRKQIIKSQEYDFVIVNYDGLLSLAHVAKHYGGFDLIIVDEANFVKNPSTMRWKSLNSLVAPDTWVWALTGTPAPQSPVDAYGLAKLVTPNTVPKYLTAWKDKVMLKVSQFKYVAKSEAPQIVHRALQPAIRYTKEMCLDLPPIITLTRSVEMSPQQKKYYDAMKVRAVVEAAGETITAVNAAIVINKLLQISAGASYSDDGETVVFDCTPRLNALQEILDDTDKKVLIFAPFRHSIETIQEFLHKNGVSSRVITGDVSATKRGEIFNDFQTKPDPRVLVIQPQSASHGVTLTEADTVVFWGPVSSVETYLQCIARAHRIGQTGTSVTVHHIEGSDIERKMFAQLEKRIENHNLVVDIYNAEMQTLKGP